MLSALKPPRLKLPLIPISSEYERLLVDETAPDVGGGPMDLNATADEVLADATVADEGLAEKLMSRLFTTRGLILCTVLVVAALCVGVLRGAYESDEASLAAKATEGMFQLTGVSSRDADVHHAQRGGQGHAKIEEGDSIPVEERFAPRAAAMPREDDGRAQRLVEEVAASRGKRSAVRAALDARSRVAKHPEKKREVAELGRVDASRGISAKTVSATTRGEDAIDRDEEPFARESTANGGSSAEEREGRDRRGRGYPRGGTGGEGKDEEGASSPGVATKRATRGGGRVGRSAGDARDADGTRGDASGGAGAVGGVHPELGEGGARAEIQGVRAQRRPGHVTGR